MTTNPADSGPPQLPPMRTIGELRAALTMGYGFPGDADDFEAELARALNHADPADLSGIVRLVEEFRGRITARQDPGFDSAVAAAVAEIEAARKATR
ncbi:DUF6247 family protein [Streptomyces sp. PR69]|uniref:DUF6247 family protein n=1 Tax=Streptomyces sp. PR69 TaxID=2984950 RepID=UPI00226553E0|nr:DUF6247 family protein [Streptomyces sp. PR69]